LSNEWIIVEGPGEGRQAWSSGFLQTPSHPGLTLYSDRVISLVIYLGVSPVIPLFTRPARGVSASI